MNLFLMVQSHQIHENVSKIKKQQSEKFNNSPEYITTEKRQPIPFRFHASTIHISPTGQIYTQIILIVSKNQIDKKNNVPYDKTSNHFPSHTHTRKPIPQHNINTKTPETTLTTTEDIFLNTEDEYEDVGRIDAFSRQLTCSPHLCPNHITHQHSDINALEPPHSWYSPVNNGLHTCR